MNTPEEVKKQTADLQANQRANTKQQNENTKTVNSQKQEASQTEKPAAEKSSDQREVPCPFCGGHVKKRDVSGGRTELKIPFTNPPWRIPIPPFIAKLLKPDPKACSCEGEQKIKDVSDDSAKYQQVQQQAEANIEKSIELEAKLGTGGNRITYVEKSDTLMVGLGFNKNDSYKKVPEGQLSPGKPQIPKNPSEFGAFPAGYNSTAIEGVQTSPGWPSAVGNYKIVCANSFKLITGAGGISFNTKGPLTFNSGILNLTGPQVNVGSSSGPLTLEGDVVSITGKTITLTPTDANVYVRGTLTTPANVIVGGQLHAETLSFCKAVAPAKDIRSTVESANPDTTQTFQAAWGGVAIKGITSSVLDIQTYFSNIVSEPETSAISLLSPTQMLNLSNRFMTLAKMCIPIETMVTGFAWLGPIPLPVTNFPHIAGLPSMNHTHGVRVPDIECKDYASPQAVRAAVINESLTSNTPVVKKNTLQDLVKYLLALPGFIANTALVAQRAIRWVIQCFS